MTKQFAAVIPLVLSVASLARAAPQFEERLQEADRLAWLTNREQALPICAEVEQAATKAGDSRDALYAASIPVMPSLDWNRLGRLMNAGWSLGAHSRTHPHLTTLDEATAHDQTEASVAPLEQTGVRPSCFAYSYGDVNPAAAKVTSEICEVHARDLPYLLPQLDAYYFQASGRLEAWGRPHWHAYLRSRAALRRIRRTVTR